MSTPTSPTLGRAVPLGCVFRTLIPHQPLQRKEHAQDSEKTVLRERGGGPRPHSQAEKVTQTLSCHQCLGAQGPFLLALDPAGSGGLSSCSGQSVEGPQPSLGSQTGDAVPGLHWASVWYQRAGAVPCVEGVCHSPVLSPIS